MAMIKDVIGTISSYLEYERSSYDIGCFSQQEEELIKQIFGDTVDIATIGTANLAVSNRNTEDVDILISKSVARSRCKELSNISQLVEARNLCIIMASRLDRRYRAFREDTQEMLSTDGIDMDVGAILSSCTLEDDKTRNSSPGSESFLNGFSSLPASPSSIDRITDCHVLQRLKSCESPSDLFGSQADECERLRSQVSSLEAQLRTLISQAPFDRVAILDENMDLLRGSEDCRVITMGSSAALQNEQIENSPELVLIIADDALGNSRELLETKCIPWYSETSTESGFMLLGKRTHTANEHDGEVTKKSKQLEDVTEYRHSKGRSPASSVEDMAADDLLMSLLAASYIQPSSLFDCIPNVVVITDAQGIPEYGNQAWFNFFGIKRGEPGQYDWTRVVHPEDLPMVIAKWAHSIETGTPFFSEHRCINLETNACGWYLTRSQPLKDINGNITKWFSTCTDVNEMKEVQREHLRAQQRSDAVLKNCSAIIWSVDAEGVFTFFGGRTATQLGIDPANRIGRNYFELYADDPDACAALRRALAGEHFMVDLTRFGKFFQVVYAPFYDEEEGGKIGGCVGVTTDVTEIKQHLLELVKWEKIFSNSRSGMSVCDADRNILNVNPAFAAMHGGSVDSYIGLHLSQVFAEESVGMLPSLIEQFSESFHLTFESMHSRQDGTSFPVLSDCTGVCDDAGKLIFCVSSYIDLTEKKKAEEEKAMLRIKEQSAIQASALKTQFLATMSHEIRTPLNGIIGMIDLIWDSVQGTEEEEYLETAQQSAASLLTIVNDILDLSKIEAGKLKLEIIDLDLLEVIRDVVIMLSFGAREKGILLEYKTSGLTECYIRGDPGRIRQVLINLISNALKFTSEGGVMVSLDVVEKEEEYNLSSTSKTKTKRRREVTVSVIDTGVGIASEVIPTLFEPFSQADVSTTRKFGGTGLGLSISKQLINLMHGDIWAESEVGIGSRFWFTVDFEEADSVPPTTSPSFRNSFAMMEKSSSNAIGLSVDPAMRRRFRSRDEEGSPRDQADGNDGQSALKVSITK